MPRKNQHRFPATVSVLLAIALLAAISCNRENREPREPRDTSRQEPLPEPDAVETREDGLCYRLGSPTPYTGLVLQTASDNRAIYLAHYENGKLHGPQIRWHSNRRLKRIHDYDTGEKVRHREWFETGVPKIDAMMRDGVAHGRHLRWHPNGQLRFKGNFAENLKWDGHVLDLDENGEVIVDAEFDTGRYLGGTIPSGFPAGAPPSEKRDTN